MTLEPCPFCGSDKIAIVPVANIGHAVSCNGCGASSEVGPPAEMAARKWNRRAHLAQPAQAVDVDSLAQEIRRVDGSHSLGAAALAEALTPFITRALSGEKAGRVDGWQPIETAPKGRRFIAYVPI